MKLRHLHYFVKIVEAGSFSRAATTIHVAQPALSQQMAELESELGVSLLHRTARGVRATPAGEALFREAAEILRRMEQLPGIVRSAGGEPEGPVTLGMSSTLAGLFSAPFVDLCKRKLSKVSLRFITGDSLLLKARLAASTLDIAVTFEDEAVAGFIHRPLFRQRLYLLRREPLPTGAPSISLRDLASLPLLLPTNPNVTRAKLEQTFAAAGLTPSVVAEFNMLSSLLSAVEAGIGGAIIPMGDPSEIPGYRALVSVAIEPPIHLTASIVTSAASPLSRAGDAVRSLLVEFLDARLRESLPPGAEWISSEPPISRADRRIPR